jgi:nucleotide-binding universal stress UspA family protein
MFQRILLAIDNSEHSRKATAAAKRLARDSDGAVVVFHGSEKLVVHGAGEAGMDIESPQEAQVADALPTSSSKRTSTHARRRVASGRKRSPARSRTSPM